MHDEVQQCKAAAVGNQDLPMIAEGTKLSPMQVSNQLLQLKIPV
jgi:hypothetical protein